MGRWCYFSNGFEYKFRFGVQDSGFDNITGVCEDQQPPEYYHTYESDEHPFCSCNCDKEPKNPLNMLRDGENLFCDEECKQNFTGGEPNEPLDMERFCELYKFLEYCDTTGWENGCTFVPEGLDDGTTLDVWNRNGWISLNIDSVDFVLNVDKEELLTSITNSGFAVPIWEDYSKDSEGTESLYSNLSHKNTHDERRYADYVLSCLIYHMSLYDDSICGSYDC